jgi:hypothetical protein
MAKKLQEVFEFYTLFPLEAIAEVLQHPRVNLTADADSFNAASVDEEPSDEESSDEEPAVEESSDEEPSDEESSDEEPAVEEPAVEEPAVEEPDMTNPLLIASGLSGIPELTGIPKDLLEELSVDTHQFTCEDDTNDANAQEADWGELFAMADTWCANATC